MMGQLDLIGSAAATLTAELFGRKATTLHALALHGLPVPKALALSFQFARDLDQAAPEARAQRRAQLRAQLHLLRFPLAVRSSADLEDMEDGAAPGLFESVLHVGSEAELFDALRHVLESARTPLVQAYLSARHLDRAPRVAVIVQEQVIAESQGVLYTRPPGQPSSGLAILEMPGADPIWIDRQTGQAQRPAHHALSQAALQRLWQLALETENILGSARGLDVEWVWDAKGPWIVQARPVVHRQELGAEQDTALKALLDFSRSDRDRLWRLDATHNPFPLSPAQAGLVAEVAGLAPYEMRVVGGYLYTARRGLPPARSVEGNEGDVKGLFRDQLLPKMEAALDGVEEATPPGLAQALDAYRQVFRCYTEELAPAIATLKDKDQGMNPLSIWLERAHAGMLSMDALMKVVAPMAPAWDVSVPTYGETPALVHRALALMPAAADEGNESSSVKVAPPAEVSLSESDDLLFYRAQYAVRRALLALAARWHLGDEIFFMPLQRLLQVRDAVSAPPELVAEAQIARKCWQAQRDIEMPLSFMNGEPVPSRLPPDTEIWRGLGTGGFVTGRVLRVSDLHEFPNIDPEDRRVLVMPSVSPAHALAARGALAVVCEYGEHLGHGAAMARELNIPCIVGCRRAWRELRDGELVAVHGRAGLVARLANQSESRESVDPLDSA